MVGEIAFYRNRNQRRSIFTLISLKRTYRYRAETVPFRQAEYFHHLLRFREALANYSLTSFVMDGTLIGAVHQGAFVRRLFDFDLAILVDEILNFKISNRYLKTKRVTMWDGYEDLKFRKRYQFQYRFLFGAIKIHSGNVLLVTFRKTKMMVGLIQLKRFHTRPKFHLVRFDRLM